jgi:hypothetical protein
MRSEDHEAKVRRRRAGLRNEPVTKRVNAAPHLGGDRAQMVREGFAPLLPRQLDPRQRQTRKNAEEDPKGRLLPPVEDQAEHKEERETRRRRNSLG